MYDFSFYRAWNIDKIDLRLGLDFNPPSVVKLDTKKSLCMYHLLYTSDNTFPRGIPMLFIEQELRILISSGQRANG